MSDALVGVIIFGLLFGGALLGMLLAWALPTQHLSTEARDVIRVVMAMLATLSAVVLGLLTGAAINSMAEKESELRRAGVQFIMLDRTLADYGPETDAARGLLKQTLAERISQIWPADGGDVILDALGGGPGIRLVQKEIFALSPATEEQRWLQANALQYARSIAESRWTTVEQISSRFPWAFFLTVVGWLAIVFISFGLFAPRNGSVVAAFFLASISLAGAIYMILEMDQPYGGAVRIPSTALTVALEQLGGS